MISSYRNSISASAVCAFNLSSITQAFNGPFRYQENPRTAWLSTPNPLPNFQVTHKCEHGQKNISPSCFLSYNMVLIDVRMLNRQFCPSLLSSASKNGSGPLHLISYVLFSLKTGVSNNIHEGSVAFRCTCKLACTSPRPHGSLKGKSGYSVRGRRLPDLK